MQSKSIKQLLNSTPSEQEVTVKGWVRTFRSNRFIALNDGSCLKNIQCVVDFKEFDEAVLKQINTGAALRITGTWSKARAAGNPWRSP